MRYIIEHVTKNTTTIRENSRVPAVPEDATSNVIPRISKDDKERRRHDEAVAVHGEVMMNAVCEEMKYQSYTVIR